MWRLKASCLSHPNRYIGYIFFLLAGGFRVRSSRGFISKTFINFINSGLKNCCFRMNILYIYFFFFIFYFKHCFLLFIKDVLQRRHFRQRNHHGEKKRRMDIKVLCGPVSRSRIIPRDAFLSQDRELTTSSKYLR